jgi:hypothetical protein
VNVDFNKKSRKAQKKKAKTDLDPAERASASMNKEGVEHERSCCGALEVAAEFETAAWRLAWLLRRPCGVVALAGGRVSGEPE